MVRGAIGRYGMYNGVARCRCEPPDIPRILSCTPLYLGTPHTFSTIALRRHADKATGSRHLACLENGKPFFCNGYSKAYFLSGQENRSVTAMGVDDPGNNENFYLAVSRSGISSRS